MTQVPRTSDLVEFVAPGLLHGLGNNLFAIRGHTQMLGGAHGEITRAKNALLKASSKALGCLDVLRFLLGDARPDSRPQAGILLHRICEVTRVPLRDRGVRLRFRHGSSELPLAVDGTVLCQVVVEIMRRLSERLPSGFEGSLIVDLASQRAQGLALTLELEASASFLPFPIDLAAVANDAGPLLRAHGVSIEEMTGGAGLTLRVPAIRARKAQPVREEPRTAEA